MSGLTEKLRQVEKQRRHNAVVLLDMNMPRMRGTEILRQLRNDEDYRDMIIGICTGSDDPADKRTACEAGADFYVSKPLNLRALNDMCRQVEHVAVQTDANGQVSLRAVQ
jgi:CheY-like chemotaxis protein